MVLEAKVSMFVNCNSACPEQQSGQEPFLGSMLCIQRVMTFDSRSLDLNKVELHNTLC